MVLRYAHIDGLSKWGVHQSKKDIRFSNRYTEEPPSANAESRRYRGKRGRILRV